jgi:hypothetical protein
LIGALLRPAISTADNQGTPEPAIVTGFTSDQLLQLPTEFSDPDGTAPRIDVRGVDGSSSPASVTLARYTYESGGEIALPYPFPGPVAFYVESGTLTLTAVGPNVQIAEVQRDTSSSRGVTIRRGEQGNQYLIPAGDYVYTFDGDLGPTRNDGPEALTVLAVFLQPESAGTSESGEETSG